MSVSTPLTDYRLAAAAPLHGGRLREVVEDRASGRLTFIFEGLVPPFVQDAFNRDVMVNFRDFMAALARRAATGPEFSRAGSPGWRGAVGDRGAGERMEKGG